MEMTTLAVQMNILERETEFAAEIVSAEERGEICCYRQSANQSFEAFVQACKLDSVNCLYVVSEEELWKQAKEQGFATLPCRFNDEGCFDGAWMVAEGLAEVDMDFLNKTFLRCHGLPWTVLSTPRCYLREITMEDMDDLFRIYEGEHITDYMEPLYDREKEEEYQRAYIEHMYRYFGYGMWLVCRKADGRIIGRAGLEHRELGDENWLEMGYMIAEEEQKKGYATEVCRGIMEYAGEILPEEKLNCFIEEENLVSIHMMERLGFSFNGKLPIDGKVMCRFTKD